MDEQYQDIDVKNILHTLPNLVFWKDTNSCFRGCNQQFLEFLGLDSYTQLLYKTDHDLIPLKPYASAEIKIDQSILKTGATMSNRDALILNSAGEIVMMSTTKCPLYDQYQNIIGILGVMTNVTDARKMADELITAKQHAESANMAKTEFLATISHDLRTPLNGIIGLSEILLSLLTQKDHKDIIQDILSSSTQLLGLVDEILNLSSIEAGKLELIPKRFNLKALISSIITNYQVHHRPNPHVTLSYDYPEHLPIYLIADPHRITQIISNLLGNAYKFTACGEIAINVSLVEEDADQIQLAFTVEDTGMGIPHDRLDSIFGKFSQVNPSYQNKSFGVGLGLAIVKRLVLAMNGKISISSQPNQGSKFTISLPFNKQQANLIKMKSNKNKVATITSGIEIMVVEDNPINQRFFQMALEKMGCTAAIASTGQEAIDMFCNDFDLILMDIGLPDQDGFQVSKKLIDLMGDVKTPIVAVTAHVLEQDKKRCLLAGMQDVATKPISIKRLQEIISRHTKGLPPKRQYKIDTQSK
jgi:two-component system, OmpR family, aerobic respiration control sensor histidine kinase ArcB